MENIVIKNSTWEDSDIPILFGDETVYFAEATELSVLMRELGIYSSASEARRAGRVGPVPQGWTEAFKASKKRRLWIWNPS